ncbi:MAG: hypothetical protein QOG85_328 [Gaiellaceae bacterium]|jgi:hypothetical protein|nr:hypothetical protein [Gaiellaceae bacterium]
MPKLTRRQQVIGCASIVVLIALFLPWETVSLATGTVHFDGWTTGIAGWGGALLLSAAGEYLILRRLKYRIYAPPFGDTRLAAGIAAVGLVLMIYCGANLPAFNGVDTSRSYGFWLAIAAGVVELVAAIDEARDPVPTD